MSVDFEKINKCYVHIASLRISLQQASTLEQITAIANKISELEQEILNEKAKGCQELIVKKVSLIEKVERLRSELEKAESELREVETCLDGRIANLKKSLESQLAAIEESK
jgi:aspartyl/asparaginyl-tRNA synthetase